MKGALKILILAILIIFIVGCAKEEPAEENQAKPTALKPAVKVVPASTAGTSEPEEITSMTPVKCGDGVCANKEHLSESKQFKCGIDSQSQAFYCNIDIDGAFVATENYYTCNDDCTQACSGVDYDVDVCMLSGNKLQITVDDKGTASIYNFLFKIDGSNIDYLRYGYGPEGKWNWEITNLKPVFGSIESISFLPLLKNKDGTVKGCSNKEIAVEDLEDC